MSTKTASHEVKEIKSKFNDEFDNYFKKLFLKKSFTGFEIETFSCYKKIICLV